VRLLIKAFNKEQEDYIWDRWIRLCPYMELGQIEFISFDDYKKALLKPKATEKTPEEIIAEMMPVIKAHENNDTKERSFD